VDAYLQRLSAMKLNNPVLVGFGIRDKQSFDSACRYANGAIIGSAFVKALQNSQDEPGTIKQFFQTILQ